MLDGHGLKTCWGWGASRIKNDPLPEVPVGRLRFGKDGKEAPANLPKCIISPLHNRPVGFRNALVVEPPETFCPLACIALIAQATPKFGDGTATLKFRLGLLIFDNSL